MFLGQEGFIWWIGVVEDVEDPLLMGRARVRIFGYHAPYVENEEKTALQDYDANRNPVSELPWAVTIMPANMPNAYGKPRLGDWVVGFFLDGKEAQEPAIMGYIPGYASDQKFGKYNTVEKNFKQVYANNTPYVTKDDNFYSLCNRFSFKTEGGHSIEMLDEGDESLEIKHNSGAVFTMKTDEGGNSIIAIGHPTGAYLVFGPDGKIYASSEIIVG